MPPTIDARVLGQILLIESLVAQLPDKATMLQFAARGLEDLPGTGKVWFQEALTVPNSPSARTFEIRHNGHLHSILCFEVSDEPTFSIYAPYLGNLAFMLGIVFDERIQGLENERYRNQLESLVASRTQELSQSEARSRSMLQTALDGVWLVDSNLRLLETNEAACSMLGYSHDELLGMAIDQIEALGPSEGLQVRLPRLEQHGSDLFESRHRRKDGTVFPVEISITFLKELDQAVVFIRDITERKQAEDQNARLQAQLQQAQKMDSLGTLAGGIAHDMNNVLGAILALAGIHLETSREGTTLRKDMETIAKACQRGGAMVKALLGFARQGLAEERDVDLNVLVREQVALLERTTFQRVHLITDLEADLHPEKGDPAALSHALMNLCMNAVDAMPAAGTLTLSTRNEADGTVSIEVADTGSGMPKEVLDQALDPFFTTKARGKGTGLGLSQVYSTAKAHGGTLVMRSEPGKGTSVVLGFQANRAIRQQQGIKGGTAALRPRRSLHVLLVDDDELIRGSIPAVLEALGHRTTTVSGGEEAIMGLGEGLQPDVVILDMNMPQMGGAETLPRLRALRPALPILVATGCPDQASLDLVAAHPHVALLAKPFDQETLRQALEVLMS